jgi:hypothetical protein
MKPLKVRHGPVSVSSRRRAERLLVDHLPQLTQRALELALLGDPVALKVCIDRAWPVATPAPPAPKEAA